MPGSSRSRVSGAGLARVQQGAPQTDDADIAGVRAKIGCREPAGYEVGRSTLVPCAPRVPDLPPQHPSEPSIESIPANGAWSSGPAGNNSRNQSRLG